MSKPKKVGVKNVGQNLWRDTSSGIYYGFTKVGGKQFRKSLHTKDRKTADEALRVWLVKFGKTLQNPSVLETPLFSEVAAQWLASANVGKADSTQATNRDLVVALNLFFGARKIKTITAIDVDQWRVARSQAISRYGSVLSTRRANYEIDTLRRVFDYAHRVRQCIGDNPSLFLKRQRKQDRDVKTKVRPSREEFALILTELRKLPVAGKPGGAADVIEFLALTGIRIGSLKYVTLDRIDTMNNRIQIYNQKKKRWFDLPIFPSLAAFLHRYLPTVPHVVGDAKLFPLTSVRESLSCACKRAGGPIITPHDLRHFFASTALEATGDYQAVSSWLNHCDGGILLAKTYAHLGQNHEQKQAAKLDFDLI
jgi:integrase